METGIRRAWLAATALSLVTAPAAATQDAVPPPPPPLIEIPPAPAQPEADSAAAPAQQSEAPRPKARSRRRSRPDPVPSPAPPPLLWPTPAAFRETGDSADGYRWVEVVAPVGSNLREYYRIRQDICDPVAQRQRQRNCLRWLLMNAASFGYGPSPVGASVRIQSGANYYFLPICETPPLWDRRIIINVRRGSHQVRLSC
jgi:hypothetical protein